MLRCSPSAYKDHTKKACTGGDGNEVFTPAEKCPWFVSNPINFSCYSMVLYRVEEVYRLGRNTPLDLDKLNKTVYAVTYKRLKDDYVRMDPSKEEYYDEANVDYGTYHDKGVFRGATDIQTSDDQETEKLRYCTYHLDTSIDPDAVEVDCSWCKYDTSAAPTGDPATEHIVCT